MTCDILATETQQLHFPTQKSATFCELETKKSTFFQGTSKQTKKWLILFLCFDWLPLHPTHTVTGIVVALQKVVKLKTQLNHLKLWIQSSVFCLQWVEKKKERKIDRWGGEGVGVPLKMRTLYCPELVVSIRLLTQTHIGTWCNNARNATFILRARLPWQPQERGCAVTGQKFSLAESWQQLCRTEVNPHSEQPILFHVDWNTQSVTAPFLSTEVSSGHTTKLLLSCVSL